MSLRARAPIQGLLALTLVVAMVPARAVAQTAGKPPDSGTASVPGADSSGEKTDTGIDATGIESIDDDSVSSPASPPAAASPPATSGTSGPASPASPTSPTSTGIFQNGPWNQGTTLEQRSKARAIFLEANELARRRFYATAVTQYKDAIALWQHPAFFYNLALAYLHLGQHIDAYENLTRALQHGPEPLHGKYAQARQQQVQLEAQLGHIEVISNEPGATIMLDGTPLFTGPGRYQGALRPGAHQIVGTKTGLEAVILPAVLSPGEHGRFEIAFEHPVVRVPVRRWAAWKSWSVVTVGAVATLGAAYLDWDSSRAFGDHDREFVERCQKGCTANELETDLTGLEDRLQRAERDQRFAIIGYAIGGTALITGVVLAYLGRERTIVLQPETERAAVSPVITADGVGASASFRF